MLEVEEGDAGDACLQAYLSGYEEQVIVELRPSVELWK